MNELKLDRKQIIQVLREWRLKKSRQENVKLFMILQNKTIDAIAEIMPQNREEFVQIKGLGERKYEKYGEEILQLLRSQENPVDLFSYHPPSPAPAFSEQTLIEKISKKVFTVSQYLDLVNDVLRPMQLSVQGEISSVSYRKHLYFGLKDTKDESKLEALMWESDLKYCGIKPVEGMEVVIHGFMEIYKPMGKATFRAQSMELVGEGALKKAYDDLKRKLEAEGCFDPERKKPIPNFPVRLGVVTSKHGAVIHDLLTNLGKYGYKIQLYDTRVEGVSAIKELISALRYFRDKPIDLLLVIRGGGSLESLQAFNSEVLLRSVLDYPVPIIAGIGHDKDVPLFSMIADAAFSTPTAVAREINRSWDSAQEKLRYYEHALLHRYAPLLVGARHAIERALGQGERFYGKLCYQQERLNRTFEAILHRFLSQTEQRKQGLKHKETHLQERFLQDLSSIKLHIEHYAESLRKNNPERQLKLGYSIVFNKNKAISSISQLALKDQMKIRLADGEVLSTVEELNQRREDGKSEPEQDFETA
jgi:exodeoxyribonuclease VII large subunit